MHGMLMQGIKYGNFCLHPFHNCTHDLRLSLLPNTEQHTTALQHFLPS
jgi:hypothetical protein